MKRSVAFVLACTFTIASIVPVSAVAGCGLFGGGRGLFGGRFFHRQHAGFSYQSSYHAYYSAPVQSYNYSGSYAAPSCAGGACSVQGYYATPQAPAKALPVPQAPAKSTPQGVPQTSIPPEVQSFLGQLNAMRAQRGLPMVSYDVYCYNDARVNNNFQLMRGIGHFFMGCARRQNAAIGQSSSYQVLIGWCNSPGHAEALFDPSIRLAAVAHDGQAWTFSAR